MLPRSVPKGFPEISGGIFYEGVGVYGIVTAKKTVMQSTRRGDGVYRETTFPIFGLG